MKRNSEFGTTAHCYELATFSRVIVASIEKKIMGKRATGIDANPLKH